MSSGIFQISRLQPCHEYKMISVSSISKPSPLNTLSQASFSVCLQELTVAINTSSWKMSSGYRVNSEVQTSTLKRLTPLYQSCVVNTWSWTCQEAYFIQASDAQFLEKSNLLSEKIVYLMYNGYRILHRNKGHSILLGEWKKKPILDFYHSLSFDDCIHMKYTAYLKWYTLKTRSCAPT